MGQAEKMRQSRASSFGYLIQKTARRIDSELKVRLAESGVNIKVFANLMMLAEEDGINQRQLGKKLDFPEYYTSRNIDSLVESGFVVREPDPNSRRSFLIFLTTEGREKAAELRGIIQANNNTSLAALTKAERVTIVALLQKVVGIEPT